MVKDFTTNYEPLTIHQFLPCGRSERLIVMVDSLLLGILPPTMNH